MQEFIIFWFYSGTSLQRPPWGHGLQTIVERWPLMGFCHACLMVYIKKTPRNGYDALDITLTKVITDDGNFLPPLIFEMHSGKFKKSKKLFKDGG